MSFRRFRKSARAHAHGQNPGAKGESPDLYSHRTPLFPGRPSCISVHQPLESQDSYDKRVDSTSRSFSHLLHDFL